jgi:hypothetical protein
MQNKELDETRDAICAVVAKAGTITMERSRPSLRRDDVPVNCPSYHHDPLALCQGQFLHFLDLAERSLDLLGKAHCHSEPLVSVVSVAVLLGHFPCHSEARLSAFVFLERLPYRLQT